MAEKLELLWDIAEHFVCRSTKNKSENGCKKQLPSDYLWPNCGSYTSIPAWEALDCPSEGSFVAGIPLLPSQWVSGLRAVMAPKDVSLSEGLAATVLILFAFNRDATSVLMPGNQRVERKKNPLLLYLAFISCVAWWYMLFKALHVYINCTFN